MGRILKAHQPCLNPECGSSDAMNVHEDGSAYCWSCKKVFDKEVVENGVIEKEYKKSPSPSPFKKLTSLEEVNDFISRGFKDRGITKAVCEYFGVKVSFDSNGEIDAHYYPYGEKEITAYKVRRLPKDFTWISKSSGMFGQRMFNGGGKRLIITEGEMDALSIAQAYMDKYQVIYPVVGLSSASMTKSALENRDWIRSFKEVVLCIDNDGPGDIALAELIKIVGVDKAKICKLPVKDANDMLCQHGSMNLLRAIWDATPYVPAGIISKEDIWKQITERNNVISVPYPDCMAGVNSKIKGMRLGEIILIIAGTGSGKSSLTREIILKIEESTEDKIGIIALEESPGETGMKLSGMALNRNPAYEEIPDEELKVGFDKVFGKDKLVVLDHQGSIKDESIVSQLDYMCLVDCKYLIIDHITILVSEGAEGLTGNEAIDKIMNDLIRIIKQYNVCIILVSHLRKVPTGRASFEQGQMPTLDDIRGSGSIKQVSYDIIAVTRNMSAEDELERNTIFMSVLKSRTIGLTGPVRGSIYDHKTGRLSAQTDEDLLNESFKKIAKE